MFEIITEDNIEDVFMLVKALRKKAYELFGTFYVPLFQIIEFDPNTKIGIIKCRREDLDKLRVLFAFFRRINSDKLVVINDIYCSGTLKKLKEKTKGVEQFKLNA